MPFYIYVFSFIYFNNFPFLIAVGKLIHRCCFIICSLLKRSLFGRGAYLKAGSSSVTYCRLKYVFLWYLKRKINNDKSTYYYGHWLYIFYRTKTHLGFVFFQCIENGNILNTFCKLRCCCHLSFYSNFHCSIHISNICFVFMCCKILL